MYRQETRNAQTLLAGEGQLLELISEGAPLMQVLDRVCTALDVQVGNVVSLVLFPEDKEHTRHTIAQRAADFGLSPFSCKPILSARERLLGTLEMYCCVSRQPTQGEEELIEHAANLAALAIQHFNHDVEAENLPWDWNEAPDCTPREGPLPSN